MKTPLKTLGASLLFAVLLCSSAVVAGTISIDWSTDKEPVSYVPGDTVTFKIQLTEDGKPLAGKKLNWVRTGDDQKTEKGEGTSSEAAPIEIKTVIDKAGFVRIEVTIFNEDGTPVNGNDGKPLKFEGGVGATPEKLESIPEPADFDAFWAGQKAELAKVPLKFTLTEVPSKNPDFLLYDVRVDCAGGKQVSGYLTKPKDAAPKSLEAKVGFMGYGVGSPTPDYQLGKLVFVINAHGIENGKDEAYYKKLQEGELKGYALNNVQNAKPETCYFNGMALRVMRALEFVKAQPEWDGKTLIATGGSQGGLQSLWAAGLDSSVTQCNVFKPWCCDLGGGSLGRVQGWHPDYTKALDYYDPVNHAKRIKSQNVTIVSGLGDYICPPSGVSVLYNNIKVPKQITYVQGSRHGYDPVNPVKQKISSK